MPKREAIKDMLIEEMRKYQTHQLFASRNALRQKYGVSRSTIDRIIGELIAEGYLYTVKGSGTYVAPHLAPMNCIHGYESRYVWAILIPDVRYSAYPSFFSGIEAYACQYGIDIMICNTDDAEEREYALICRLIAANVNGVVIVPTRNVNIENYKRLIKNGTPIVFWNRVVDELTTVPQICLNNHMGGMLATRHLLKCGYKRIAFIMQGRFRSNMDRYFGYQTALSLAGVEGRTEYVPLDLDDFGPENENVKNCVQRVLDMDVPPDAFVLSLDTLALPVMELLSERGIRVPEDFGVVGFESNIDWIDARMKKQLTYISINSVQSGRLVAETLYSLMLDNSASIPKITTIMPELIERETTRKTIGEDR